MDEALGRDQEELGFLDTSWPWGILSVEWMATMCLPHVSKNAYSFPGFVPLTLGTFFPSSELDRNKEGNSSKFSGSCMKGGKGQNCDIFF